MKAVRGECRTGYSGFTLLEVLVATAVLGTAVAALFGLLAGSLFNARRLQAPEQALLLARSELQALLTASDQGRASPPALPLDQTVSGLWNEQFRWVARATRVPASQPPIPGQLMLVRIAFDAYWKAAPEERERRLSLETVQLWQEPRQVVQ
jgi:prepilin-type N-terminal cleavage/methylation domain-containing protein